MLAQERSGTFVAFDQHERSSGYEIVWLNMAHLHSIEPCQVPDASGPHACAIMDGHQSGYNSRLFRSVKLYAPAVRYILDLPNPTTPAAVITAPDAALVGDPVALSVTVADPDYGDTWTYEWSESDATLSGGTFSAAVYTGHRLYASWRTGRWWCRCVSLTTRGSPSLRPIRSA